MRKTAFRALAGVLFAAVVSSASCTGNPPGLWPNCVEGQWSFGCEGIVSDNSCGCKLTTKRQYAPYCAVNEAQAIAKFTAVFPRAISGTVNCIQGAPGMLKQPNDWAPAAGDVRLAEATQVLGPLSSALPRGDAGVRTFGPGDCTVNPTSDNTCVACVKTSCCTDYVACFNSSLCTCWVSCKASGNDDATCALPAACGPLDSVSSSAASCLDANCGAECGTMSTGTGAGGGSSCSCGTSSSSSGSTCVPGLGMAGDVCTGDSSCQSCNCDAPSMTCF